MLKVLHTGDWHIGSFPGPEVGGQNARFQDICRCLDFQAMYAEEHRPDLIVVSGDIFHQARVWSDRGLRESRTAIDHIRRLSNVAPTVVLRGTPNHDSEEQFEMLTTAFYGDDSVSVVTEPEVIHIHTYHGQRVDVACIPGFDRGVHRAAHPGLSREEETQVFTDELAKVVLGLKAQCEPGVTSILSTHFTVPGCNMESGQTALFAQFEPVIYPDTLKAADFDLVALGHIHRPQQLPEAGRAVFYCGSITGLNFNDEGQPRGFYIHDIDDDGEAWSEYIETPYRLCGGGQIVTMDDKAHYIDAWDLLIAHPPCTYLSNAGARHLWKGHQLQEDRVMKGILGRDLFMRFWWADIPRICVENPVPSRVFCLPEYTQIIQPYQFGHPYSKKTCLWLKNLDPVAPTNIVEPIATWCPSGSYSHKHDEKNKGMFTRDRARNRAKTFPGVARAFAEQFGGQL